jgi:hypothetical protein
MRKGRIKLLNLYVRIYKSESDWLAGWLGLCAWLLGNDNYCCIRGRSRIFLFSTTSWPVNENEIWLVRTFVNVEIVTEDVEIGVSWSTRGLD